jgi:hypothetical protein
MVQRNEEDIDAGFLDLIRGTNPCLDPLQALRKWLKEEHKSRKGTEIDLSDWEDYWDPVRILPLPHLPQVWRR